MKRKDAPEILPKDVRWPAPDRSLAQAQSTCGLTAGGSLAGKLSSEAWSVFSQSLGGSRIASGPAERAAPDWPTGPGAVLPRAVALAGTSPSPRRQRRTNRAAPRPTTAAPAAAMIPVLRFHFMRGSLSSRVAVRLAFEGRRASVLADMT